MLTRKSRAKGVPVDPVIPTAFPDATSASGQDSWHIPVAEMSRMSKEKELVLETRSVSSQGTFESGGKDEDDPAAQANDMENIALHVLNIDDDDPSANPWTFRTWFLGIGLSAFSSVLATVYMFKPQGVGLSASFLAIMSYVLARLLEYGIPKSGLIGRWLNPHPLNSKEHAAILIMASTAARAAKATQVIAAQKLFYSKTPNTVTCIALIFASQTLGYGVAGLMRKALVYPTKFVWPANLPTNALLETLHRNKGGQSEKFRVFYWAFALIFVYETLPEYIMPILTGVSVFCLAKQNSMVFTNLFGGANGNEGLGLFSMSFDFQYIGGGALALPLVTICNIFVGYILCAALFIGVYYGNTWRAKDFPFLSQLLFANNSTHTHYIKFNQTQILDEHSVLDEAALKRSGIPFLTATYATDILTKNLAITATITHLCLYNWKDVANAWSFLSPKYLRTLFVDPRSWNFKFWNTDADVPDETEELDPHYRLMLAYKEVPDWWYKIVFLVAGVGGFICIYATDSGVAWWSYLIAILLATIMILFIGAQAGLSGFHAPVGPIMLLCGSYLQPGRPLTMMYFTLFSDNIVTQGLLLLEDLKLGQYAKLPPRCTFTMQIIGTLVGAVLNYAMMQTITTNQRDILLSIEGTNIWSGASVQAFNTESISWGALSKHLFSIGDRYQWIPLALPIGFLLPVPFYLLYRRFPTSPFKFNLWHIPIVTAHLGSLAGGINASRTSFFLVAFWSQFWLRKYRPAWFLKFNYVLAAGLEGGTEVVVFLLTFIFLGASGKAIKFPTYWGNNAAHGNIDYCMDDPGKR